MRRAFRLAETAELTVDDLRIRERVTAWSEPERARAHRVVLVRSGLFRLRLDGWEAVVDPLSAYVGRPGAEQRIAHRPAREDACTVLTLDERLAGELLPAADPGAPLRTSAAVDLAHRTLLARSRAGADAFELVERVVRLVGALLREPAAHRPAGAAPSHRRLADAAREALVHDPAGPGLQALARHLGVSRSHLSRVFRAETGETLTRFRNRVRVRAALDRLAAGAADLAVLAADLGFADHAHLTRAVRAEVGAPPSRVRELLGP